MSGWQIVALVAVVLAWLVAFRFVGDGVVEMAMISARFTTCLPPSAVSK